MGGESCSSTYDTAQYYGGGQVPGVDLADPGRKGVYVYDLPLLGLRSYMYHTHRIATRLNHLPY